MSCSLSVFFIENSLCHFMPESKLFYHINLGSPGFWAETSLWAFCATSELSIPSTWAAGWAEWSTAIHSLHNKNKQNLGQKSPKSEISQYPRMLGLVWQGVCSVVLIGWREKSSCSPPAVPGVLRPRVGRMLHEDGTLPSSSSSSPPTGAFHWEQNIPRGWRRNATQFRENKDIFPLLIVCCLASYWLTFLQSCYLFFFAIYWVLEAFNQL